MLGFLKSRKKKRLKKEYEVLMLRARDIQRSGDLKSYSRIIAQSEDILAKIQALESEHG